jgi:hypothetical protein
VPEPPPLPDGVLIQSVVVDDRGREGGWRVWSDGRHEGRAAGEEDWQAGPPLDAAGMDEIAAILDDADLAAMEGIHRREVATEHESALWFQVARPGAPPVTVGLLDGAPLEALDRLVARLAPVLSGGAVQ